MKTMRVGYVLLLTACLVGWCSAAVTVQSPNGGEKIPAQGTWLITWRCDAGTTQVRIEFSFTDGVFWEVVAPAAACGQGRGSYRWTVPEISSASCLIRITDLRKAGGADESDAAFTVFPCALQMDYDHDCAVTLADFAALAREWLGCGDPYDPACLGNRRPRIVSLPASYTPEQRYTYDIKAVDPDGDWLTYTLLRGPQGMTVDPSSGALTWSGAEQHGPVPVIIEVRDESGAADIQAFELNGPTSPPPAQVRFAGAPVDGYPSLAERRVLVYTNAVRLAPQQYRDRYMAGFRPDPGGIFQTQGPVEPVHYTSQLNQSARSHAMDMADNGCFQHDSCDGTAWTDRIRSFYPNADWIAENIAMGYPTAKAMVDAWLCDETGGRCAADGTLEAGHRSNMVNVNYDRLGAGTAQHGVSAWRRCWVQDFASGEPLTQPPIVAACHDFLAAGRTSFLLNYRDTGNQPPASVQVVVGETVYDMSLDLGTASAGTYRLDLPKTPGCREYYFLAVTASGETWRYPGPGVFLTDGELLCHQDYRN